MRSSYPRAAAARKPPPPPESEARKAVSRDDLWRVHDAARVFFHRATSARQDGQFFLKAKEDLELAFERIADGARKA